MNNNVNQTSIVPVKKDKNIPTKEFVRISNSLYENPDDIMNSTANRMKVYCHFIHFVEEGGLPRDFVDPEYYCIHWGIIAKYMLRYVDEMNVHHAYSALAMGREKARQTILQCVRGLAPKVSSGIVNVFSKLYFREKDKKKELTTSRKKKLSLIDELIMGYEEEREGRKFTEQSDGIKKKREAVYEFLKHVDNML